MQTFSDILGKEIRLVASQNGPALGAAIFAAVASGTLPLDEAIQRLGKTKQEYYTPVLDNKKLYDKLYGKFLHKFKWLEW